MTLTVRATVLDTTVDPASRDRRRPWLVRLRVDQVVEGELADEQRELAVLVHSPSREFRTSDPIGQQFHISFGDPLSNPYAGSLKVSRP